MMQGNEIYKIYGTDYLKMTLQILDASDLLGELEKKCEKLHTLKEKLKIVIKPNVLGVIPAEFGATTHLELIEGLIIFLQKNGYSGITVMEGSWVGDKTEEAFEILGFTELAGRYGVTLTDTQKEKSFPVMCKGMELKICECVKLADFLINVPVLKGHCQTMITCALKNMKGLLPNSEKRRFHSLGLHKPIAHLNSYIHQDFILIDHICGDQDFEEGGNPVVTNCVMTALDPVLVDAYTATLLGYQPYDIEYVRLAQELGVGSADVDALHIRIIGGEEYEVTPDIHKILQVSYAIDEMDCCSACYAQLIEAMERLKEEGIDPSRLPGRISIGQGFRGKQGSYGIGICTGKHKYFVPGCPPSGEDIYRELKNWITAHDAS